jgi:PAS domain S-box-containing protein
MKTNNKEISNEYFSLKDTNLKRVFFIANIYIAILTIGCHFLYGISISLALGIFGCLIFATSKLYEYKKIDHIQAAEFVILCSILFLIPICTFYTGGLYSPIIWWYIMIPVVSLLIFGKSKLTNINTFICLFSIAIISILELCGFKYPTFQDNYLTVGIILSIFTLLGIILNFSIISEGQKFSAYQTLSSEQLRLKKSEASYKDIFENTDDLIHSVLLENGKFSFVNPSWLNALGYSMADIENLHIENIIHAESALTYKNLRERLVLGEEVKNINLTFVAKNNSKVFVQGKASCIFENGMPYATRGIYKNITERLIAETKIAKSQLAFEEAQELAMIGSWELNFIDRIPVWSKQMRKIFELENCPNELLYKEFQEKIFEADRTVVENFMNEIFVNGTVNQIEIRILDYTGETKYLSILGEPLKSKNRGIVVGVKGTAQDITKQKMVDIAKSNFLSTMSHEIRTPINGVIGITNLLLDEKLTDTQKDYVETLNFSSQQLLAIVSDILDFSKIESGNFSFEKVSFNMFEVCNHVFKLFESKAQEKHLQYTLVTSSMDTYSIYGDRVRLSQVLSNLVSNAIKFTKKGLVELKYSIKEELADQITVLFEVKDTGIGIPQRYQDKIFDSFSQADDTVTRQYGGTGLGLTISKRLVELQGGKLAVSSVHGKGSTFSVELTFDKHSFKGDKLMQNEVLFKGSSHLKSLSGMNILVAEDNRVNAMVLTRFLNKWEIKNSVVSNGQEAVKLLNEGKQFDLILMDLQMPILDGREATKIIRKSTNLNISNIPIIALTADALVESQRTLVLNGFNDCVTKPFSPELLFKMLCKYQKSTVV